jgi:hypothetical protein
MDIKERVQLIRSVYFYVLRIRDSNGILKYEISGHNDKEVYFIMLKKKFIEPEIKYEIQRRLLDMA